MSPSTTSGAPLEGYHVFISYAHEDSAIADRIEASLVQAGVRCWRDPRVAPGRFSDQIAAAIRNCPVFLVLVSRRSVASQWVEDELSLARVHRRMVIPVVIDRTEPESLTGVWAFLAATTQFFTVRRGEEDQILHIRDTVRSLLAQDVDLPLGEPVPAKTRRSGFWPKVIVWAGRMRRPAAIRHASTVGTRDGRSRRRWLAGVLSLIAPGLGHLYAGKAIVGMRMYASITVLNLANSLAWPSLLPAPANILVGATLLGGAFLYMIFAAVREAKRAPAPFPLRRYNRWWTYVIYALSVLVITGLLSVTVTRRSRIVGGSMEDTILDGDFVIVSMIATGPRIPFTQTRLPGLTGVRPGDVVQYHPGGDQRDVHICRCVAVGGQVIEYRNKTLFVDGVVMREPYVKHVAFDVTPSRDTLSPFRVPIGYVYVMGDNRDNSEDSRSVGPISLRFVAGRLTCVYFSWDKVRSLPRLGRLGKRL
jgi:signal peptidase I